MITKTSVASMPIDMKIVVQVHGRRRLAMRMKVIAIAIKVIAWACMGDLESEVRPPE